MSYVQTFPRGLGAANAGQLAASTFGAGASAGTAALVASGAIAGPVGIAISAGIALIAPLLEGVINGCGQTCEVTSTWANQVEATLQQNIAAYFALPTPRSTVDQAAAIQNFNTAWNALVAQCNNPSLGSAGQACISDRQAGACHYTQPASSVPPWGSPAAGECWNWFSGYLYPIQNDPDVQAPSAGTVPASISNALDSITGSAAAGGVNLGTIGLIAAAALLAWVVLK